MIFSVQYESVLKLWLYRIKSLTHRLFFRAAAFALLAIASSLAAVLFAPYVPDRFADLVGGKAVDGILSMMASSMLVVMTFALSTMVSAYSTATQIATPRSTKLIIDDSRSHSAISIFLGAFIYSVVSLIALSTDYYGEKGRVILLGVTILVLASVVWTVIRWVEELKNMGSVHETIRRVEMVATKALRERVINPTFGCHEIKNIPESSLRILSHDIGYIKNIDIDHLAKLANENHIEVYVENEVGAFLHKNSALVSITGLDHLSEDLIEKFQSSFAIGDFRTFEFDPRYGITALSGIAIKALSPSLNDPGTAIDVIGSLVRVLGHWEEKQAGENKSATKYDNIYFPKLTVHDLVNDSFYGLAKEGSNHLQVVKSLQGAMEALMQIEDEDFKNAAREHLKLINERAWSEVSLTTDLKNITSSNMIGESQRHEH